MKRIVLEVDEQAGNAYQSLSLVKQQQFMEAISMLLKKAVNDATATDYKKAMDEFGNKALQNGLTEEILQGILKGND